jgi:rhodanese-related sulfurtransferase
MFGGLFSTTDIITAVNFDDMMDVINDETEVPYKKKTLIINTLSSKNQECLIYKTITLSMEETLMNEIIQSGTMKNHNIIVYGQYGGDENVKRKCQQLRSLGFIHIFEYIGGIFEWCLLQDIYGVEMFPTTSKPVDILLFRSPRNKGFHIDYKK